MSSNCASNPFLELYRSEQNLKQAMLQSLQGQSLQVGWSAPANIALIKYWGKKGEQLPANASLSLTLNEAQTKTRISATFAPAPELSFRFHGEAQPQFELKLKKYVEKLSASEAPFLRFLKLDIASENTFPHSTGIASSASSMAALSLCLCELEQQLFKAWDEAMALNQNPGFLTRASHLARLGSGSACRSLFTPYAQWGRDLEVEGSSDTHAIPYTKLHENFKQLCDWILVASSKPKQTSSRLGHELMNEHPYAPARYQRANQHMRGLMLALSQGDFASFGQIIETEALDLHGLMMSSNPAFILMEPATIEIWKRITLWRKQTNIPAYMTLDAGPNIHLLFPPQYEAQVEELITSQLLPYLENQSVIKDRVGPGPMRL